MGWLRELMHVAGFASYGSLARASLANPSWPSSTKVQERSLATMLSRFDHGVELEWLSDRPVVQQVLAETLGCTVADIRTPLLRTNDSPQPPRRLRFEVLPQAQALDLCEESLPPGIPPLLMMPTTWTRCIWATRPGDGTTLVGQWLDARGRAEVTQIRDREQLLELPNVGPPLFVEALVSLDPFPENWRPERPICLASVQVETTAALGQAGWTILEVPSLDRTLRSIITWVAQRIGGQAKFDVDGAERWIRESLIGPGIVETLGDVLGWCGHLAEFGLEATRPRTHRQLLNAITKRALAPLAKVRDTTASSWSRKVPDLLVAMAEHSLLIRETDLLGARTLESWVELFPEEDRVGPDLDWMKTHLSAASKVIRARDLERAAAQFPPGAHRWLGLLRDSGLLQPVNEQDYALRPHHLVRLCRHIANEGLIQGSSAVWGTALFHPRAKQAVWRELKHRVEVNPEALVDSVLDDLDEESAGTVLALEATVAAAGVSILSGKELPATITEQLLDESCALALEHPDQPPSFRIGLGSVEGVDSRTLWWLSMIALGEASNHARRARPASLDPWIQNSPPAELDILLDSLLMQTSRMAQPRPDWVIGAFLMLDRLRQTIGAVMTRTGRPHPVLASGIALDEIQHGVLEWASLLPVLDNELLFDVFRGMAKHRGVAEGTWVKAFWHAFEESSVMGEVRDFAQRHTDVLSPHIPESLGLAWLDGVRDTPCEELLAAIPENIVLTWLDRRDVNDSPLPAVVIQNAREELLERMLADLDEHDEALLPLFWARVPDRVVSRLHRFRVMFPARAGRWIDMAPVSQSKALFKAAALDEWLKASQPLLLALRRYCLRCIDERSDTWQLAYSWLVRIERVLRR